jgi:hypothetical protein
MDIWQRNTSFAAIANAAYSADRWRFVTVGGQVSTVSRDTDVPASVNVNYSHKTAITTANASPAAGHTLLNDIYLEGYDFLPLKGKSIVLSFWVKSSLTGTYCIGFKNNAANRSLVKTYTIDVANTWERKTIAIEHDTTGTWEYTNSRGLVVCFTLMSGTTFQTTADVWAAGDFHATSAQANFAATIGNAFFLTRVQIEEGVAPTQFEERPFSEELQLCRRYYETSVPYGTFTFASTSSAELGAGGSTSDLAFNTKYAVEKRGAPTVTVYAASSGTSGSIRNFTTAADVGTLTVDSGTPGFRITKAGGITAGSFYGYHWTAHAEV